MDSKPSLLYASPFPPIKSGISDYSALLIRYLDKYFDITLYVDNYDISVKELNEYQIVKFADNAIDFGNYDYFLYNIGNIPAYHRYIYEAALAHPGLVILHDYILYYLFIGHYFEKGSLYSEIYKKQGLDDYLLLKEEVKNNETPLWMRHDLAPHFPMNKELLDSGNKFMVHSEYALGKVLDEGVVSEERIRKINLFDQVDETEVTIDKEKLFSKYSVPNDAVIIASLGNIASTKLNKELCSAVRRIREKGFEKICYLMVGEGNYVDDELEEGFIIKTGYVSIEEFNSFIVHSDIIANLRYPTMGETSASIIRALHFGKVCITNNGGWFTEVPNECVCKIELENVEDNIVEAIQRIIEDSDYSNTVSNNAKKYIEEYYSPNLISKQIFEFITKSK